MGDERIAEAVERCIPDTWFRAASYSTPMSFLQGHESSERIAPLREGERKLGWLVLPPFQRPPVWTQAQQIRFIESCWLGLPIGVFVYNRDPRLDGEFDNWLLDGQQRVTSVYAYMADEFPVMGYRFSELTAPDRRKWEMGVVFACLETKLSDEAALRDVYERLAYGGTPHSTPEKTPHV